MLIFRLFLLCQNSWWAAMGHNAPVCQIQHGQVGAVENQASRGRCR